MKPKVRDVEITPIIPGQVPSSKSDLAKDKVGDPRYVDASKLPYMRLVVCLLYVMTCTRPDISSLNYCYFPFYDQTFVCTLACMPVLGQIPQGHR